MIPPAHSVDSLTSLDGYLSLPLHFATCFRVLTSPSIPPPAHLSDWPGSQVVAGTGTECQATIGYGTGSRPIWLTSSCDFGSTQGALCSGVGWHAAVCHFPQYGLKATPKCSCVLWFEMPAFSDTVLNARSFPSSLFRIVLNAAAALV